MKLSYSSAYPGSGGGSTDEEGLFFPTETNRIDHFQRVPSDLRKYLEYTAHIKAEYGSVMRFVVKERLRWGDGQSSEDLKARGGAFEFDGMRLVIVPPSTTTD